MVGFLVDTNVVSELRALRPAPQVVSWIETTDTASVWISAVTVAELGRGIKRLPTGRRSADLQHWFDESVLEGFQGRILAFDKAAAIAWAELTSASEAAGRPLSFADSQIAATALVHGLTLVTRNTRDFDGLGVELLNPFILSPPPI